MAHFPSPQREAFTVATYNCLASEYLHYWNGKLSHPQQSYVNQGSFDDCHQRDLISRISLLNPDIVCLQELSAKNSQAFIAGMQQLGYFGVYEQFNQKPDGIATFYRNTKFKESGRQVIPYNDTTGRKALQLSLTSVKGANVDVFNTHLQGGANNRSVADAQLSTLIQKVNQCAHPVIVCGDMNFTPADGRFNTMAAFLQDSMKGQNIPTSMNGTTPLRLDYIWHTNTAASQSSYVAGNLSSFLTSNEPSDHIPVVATFDIPTGAQPVPYAAQQPSLYAAQQPSHYVAQQPAPYAPYVAQQPLPYVAQQPAPYAPYVAQQPLPYVAQQPAPYAPYVAQQPAPNSSLRVFNEFPGTDQSPSFRRKIFAEFNSKMQSLFFSQATYVDFAYRFADMIKYADEYDKSYRGQFLPSLYSQILLNAKNAGEASFFCSILFSFDNSNPPLQIYNDQPFINTASFRWTVFEHFNQLFQSETFASSRTYLALAPQFSMMLASSELLRKQQGGDFLTLLSQQVDQLPTGGYAKQLFGRVVADFKSQVTTPQVTAPQAITPQVVAPQVIQPMETVIQIKCKDVPNGQDLYIRGCAGGLSWSQGIKLNRIDWDTFEFRTKTPFTGEMEYKLLLNNDPTKWEEGYNHKILPGKTLETPATFPVSILPPLKKTVIQVDFPMPQGQPLFVSGTGPLGNWDRKVQMQPKGSSNTQWFITFDGEHPSFEYKLRPGDGWENRDNRKT